MTNVTFNKHIPDRVDITSAHLQCSEVIHDLFKNTPGAIRPLTTHLLSAHGKGVRAKLLLHSSMDSDGMVTGDAVRAAAAVEIVHLATLIHDDVIDEADTRRGIQSIQSKFGKKEAVLCGDYLFCLAFNVTSNLAEPYAKFAQKFTSAISRVCLGELRQFSNNHNTDIGIYDYLRTIRGKTAALFHIATYGGALIGGAPEKKLLALGRFGIYFGMIFQIVDDCKDYVLESSQAKKPTQSDICSGVINLPLLMAYLKEPALRNAPLTINLLQDVRRLGGVDYAYELAKKYEVKSQRILSQLENKKQAEELTSVLSQLMGALKVESYG